MEVLSGKFSGDREKNIKVIKTLIEQSVDTTLMTNLEDSINFSYNQALEKRLQNSDSLYQVIANLYSGIDYNSVVYQKNHWTFHIFKNFFKSCVQLTLDSNERYRAYIPTVAFLALFNEFENQDINRKIEFLEIITRRLFDDENRVIDTSDSNINYAVFFVEMLSKSKTSPDIPLEWIAAEVMGK